MQIMSATDVKQAFGAALDAAQRAPVFIKKQNRDIAVLMSMHEFEKLRQLQVERFEALADAIAAKAKARGLTKELFEQLMVDES